MSKSFLFYFILTIHFYQAFAQPEDFENKIKFVTHLSDIGAFDEANLELSQISSSSLTPFQLDTVHFLRGTIALYLKKDSISDFHLSSISDSSTLYYPSRFFNAFHFAEIKKYQDSWRKFSEIEESTSSEINQLRNFELASVSVLNKDFISFDSLSQTFNSRILELKNEQDNLRKYADISKRLRRKSAFKAGVLSAIIPGLGKVYSGNNAQALSSFISVAFFAGMTTENLVKNGWTHPQTIIFGSLFSIFYIGNIWGSAVSVQLIKMEKELENKNNILVGMRIPIQKFFR